MKLEEAKTLLSKASRWEMRDHAFGDTEMGWSLDGEEVGGGYFNGSYSHVWVKDVNGDPDTDVMFKGKEADELRQCGASLTSTRNDTEGPDTYQEGVCMKGLSREDVLEEITLMGPDRLAELRGNANLPVN